MVNGLLPKRGRAAGTDRQPTDPKTRRRPARSTIAPCYDIQAKSRSFKFSEKFRRIRVENGQNADRASNPAFKAAC